jgi:putative FmdB family regulatory protein
MPLFEYRCRSCQSEFELLIRGGAAPVCPSCGGTDLEKVLSLFAVSSDGTRQRNVETLRARHKETTEAVAKERRHFEHDDHHTH